MTPPLFDVEKIPDFMIFTSCMSVKVGVSQSMKYNEMNDIKGIYARNSCGKKRLKKLHEVIFGHCNSLS